MKTPDEYDLRDFCGHLYSAIRRETGRPWKPAEYRASLVRERIKWAMQEGVDPWELAVALDLIAIDFKHDTLDNELKMMFSISGLLQKIQTKSRPPAYWRHVYFSRFVRTEAEIEYFRRWLTTYEIADDRRDDPNWQAIKAKAEECLTRAEEKIKRENRRAVFRYHALRELE